MTHILVASLCLSPVFTMLLPTTPQKPLPSDLNALRATVPHTNYATATAHELELSSVLPIDLSGIDRLALLDKVENEIKAAFARMNSMQWNDILFKAESDRYVELSNKRNELLAQLEQSPE